MTDRIVTERFDSSITMPTPEVYYAGGDGGAGDSPSNEKEKGKETNHEARKSSLKTSEIIQHNPAVWYKHTKSLLAGIKSNWLLIFFIPAVVMTKYKGHISSIVIFIFNMLAIIPLAKILTISIDDITARIGPAYQSVLHAFSGNCVELIILGFALYDKQYSIVRSSVLGAILSNILLILGAVFLIASLPKKGRPANLNTDIDAAFFVNTSASVLALAVLALVTPATFKIAAPPETGINCDMQNISRATAIILLLLYAGLLVFQLKTHAKELIDMTEVEQHEAKYFLVFDILLAALAIAGITFCSKYLVISIEHLAEEYRLGHSFVGMVLLPTCVISNALEHYHAIKDAHKDKIDTAISLVLNTSVQIALLVGPLLVIVGWIINRPLTLDFTQLEIAVLACSVLIVNYLVADSKANWLEGAMLLASYLIIAVAFFYFPNSPTDNDASLAECNPLRRNLPPKPSSTASAAH
ncbi:3448_t:CDS:2 [Ambispora gerdemannii]|uniref:Vacuolar calcium ion transporter n=1 Tax=Ambispora gerdemannii TaxID=144530 RepID=A0A9N8V6Z7_9GLOM|nr:3448_t:CDS:2 [Ambispora gerdemannii]